MGAMQAMSASIGRCRVRRDTYCVGDHGGKNRALGIVAIVFAGDEGDSHDLEEEDGRVQERL